jgi:DNA-binding response OmpR family regulator
MSRNGARPRQFIAIVGHGPELERNEGAASVLRGLGADVRTLDLWDDPARLFEDDAVARAVVLEAMDRPDLAAFALRALRREARLAEVGAIVSVTVAQAARIEALMGFDDFVLSPYVPAELYARIRLIEWRRSEFANEERMKIGGLVIDRSAHEVQLGGRAVAFTAREFALLAYLADRRGRVVSRAELLARVWGTSYEGGARTVDIHVRRLRAKLGAALPLATLRGAGYKLAAPDTAGDEDVDDPGDEQASPGDGARVKRGRAPKRADAARPEARTRAASR